MADYYALLGVNRNASEREIRDAYRKKYKQYHIDVTENPTPHTEEMSRLLSVAREVLTRKKLRALYDADPHFVELNFGRISYKELEAEWDRRQAMSQGAPPTMPEQGNYQESAWQQAQEAERHRQAEAAARYERELRERELMAEMLRRRRQQVENLPDSGWDQPVQKKKGSPFSRRRDSTLSDQQTYSEPPRGGTSVNDMRRHFDQQTGGRYSHLGQTKRNSYADAQIAQEAYDTRPGIDIQNKAIEDSLPLLRDVEKCFKKDPLKINEEKLGKFLERFVRRINALEEDDINTASLRSSLYEFLHGRNNKLGQEGALIDMLNNAFGFGMFNSFVPNQLDAAVRIIGEIHALFPFEMEGNKVSFLISYFNQRKVRNLIKKIFQDWNDDYNWLMKNQNHRDFEAVKKEFAVTDAFALAIVYCGAVDYIVGSGRNERFIREIAQKIQERN